MNKKVLTTALLATFASAAHAQSSVTLYGIIDAGISYVNHSGTNSQKLFKYDDGVAQGSRFGLRGSEDLGGGLKAIFTLEGGFNSGTGVSGQGNTLFGRQAFVGLAKDGIGSVTFGRQYSLSTDVLGGAYSNGGNTVVGNYAYHFNDVDQLTSSRINNSVKFSSANFYGVTFGALYGFSNQAGSFAGAPPTGTAATPTAGSSRTYSFGANYAYGPFGLGAAYTDIKFPSQSVPAFSTNLANFNPGTAFGPGVLRDLRTFGVGGRYTFGPASVWALYTNTLFSPVSLASSAYTAVDVGGKYALTQALSLQLAYTYSRITGANANGHWNQINGAVDYALSKRTDVYFLTAFQDASGRAGNGNLQASIGDSNSFFGNSGNNAQNQLAFRVGLRHKF
ncbi:porin [Paraburkholderia rhizosphaerae]|uniref:Putative porin n=1 Tax=Paraburkholderia rhizosphaerae TaxID=480658 RepID=A0A4R8M2L8_9BURK|nr:porin [Paraburkholderia rhizosphaerae]TDY54005.1 putative porin [Paraburkholderia rhizosphaerae]